MKFAGSSLECAHKRPRPVVVVTISAPLGEHFVLVNKANCKIWLRVGSRPILRHVTVVGVWMVLAKSCCGTALARPALSPFSANFIGLTHLGASSAPQMVLSAFTLSLSRPRLLARRATKVLFWSGLK